MRHNTHLTPHEREKLLWEHNQGKNSSQIARELDHNKSMISREIRSKTGLGIANADSCEYSALEAQKKYQQNRQNVVVVRKISFSSISLRLFGSSFWVVTDLLNRLLPD